MTVERIALSRKEEIDLNAALIWSGRFKKTKFYRNWKKLVKHRTTTPLFSDFQTPSGEIVFSVTGTSRAKEVEALSIIRMFASQEDDIALSKIIPLLSKFSQFDFMDDLTQKLMNSENQFQKAKFNVSRSGTTIVFGLYEQEPLAFPIVDFEGNPKRQELEGYPNFICSMEFSFRANTIKIAKNTMDAWDKIKEVPPQKIFKVWMNSMNFHGNSVTTVYGQQSQWERTVINALAYLAIPDIITRIKVVNIITKGLVRNKHVKNLISIDITPARLTLLRTKVFESNKDKEANSNTAL